MIRNSLLVSAILIAPSASAAAMQNPGPMITDRPDQTESSETIIPGFIQVETGLSFTHNDESGVRLRTLEVPSTLLRLGVLPRLEARLGFPGWQRAQERSGQVTANADGVGDLELGFKLRILEQDPGQLQLSLIGSTTLPTGTTGIGSERADPTFLLTVSTDLSERVALGSNVGARWATQPTDEDRTTAGDDLETAVDAVYTLALGFSVASGIAAFAEVFGALGLENDRPDPMSVDGGITVQLRDNLQLDVSGGLGVNAAADDWFVAAGLAVRVPR